MFETNYTEEMSEKINRYMYLILIDLISKYNRGEYLKLEPVNKDIAENIVQNTKMIQSIKDGSENIAIKLDEERAGIRIN